MANYAEALSAKQAMRRKPEFSSKHLGMDLHAKSESSEKE